MTFAQVKIIYDVRSWRIIKGFEGYRVTSCGRVWSCDRKKFVRVDYNIDGYKRVELWKKSSRTWLFVHRLVALHYRGKRYTAKRNEVNHMDGDKHNNRAQNLEWCTRSENVIHSRKIKSDQFVYKGAGRWKKLSYEDAKARAGTPF